MRLRRSDPGETLPKETFYRPPPATFLFDAAGDFTAGFPELGFLNG
jgi:hypothetical protein